MVGRKKQRIVKGSKDKQVPTFRPLVKSVDKPLATIQVEESMDKVFGNDLLLELILEHLIYQTASTSTNPKINYGSIPNARLVQKNWLLTISHIFRKNRHPLYHLHNDSNFHQRFSSNSGENNRLMSNFIQTMTRPKRLEPQLAPFKLTLICSFFTPENHKVLKNLFEKCDSGLVSLLVVIPKSCSMSFVFPPFSFGILQKFTIEFVGHTHTNEISPSFLENNPVTYFIQQVINSAMELNTFEVKCSSNPATADSSVIPLGFQFLSMPPTVVTLLLRAQLSPNHLEMLTPRMQNGHIQNLQIRASSTSPFLDEKLIHKTLERHRATLKSLKLSAGRHFLHPENGVEEQPSLFRIPPMRNLKEFTVASPKWQSVNNFHMMSCNFPRLSKFFMKGITLGLFERLTEDTRRVRWKFVKSVEIWLVNQVFGTTVTLDKNRMERVNRTFCNVTSLDITICGMETSGLKYIFREMGNLKSLAINVRKGNGGDGIMTCESWDALFMGAPEWMARGLRETPDYWKRFVGTAGYDDNPSIMKLTALTKLTLATKSMDVRYQQNGDIRDRMMSEVAFHFAFVKMPQLKALQLYGRFQPNEQMILLWLKKRSSSASGDETLLYDMERKD